MFYVVERSTVEPSKYDNFANKKDHGAPQVPVTILD